jgi:hypothetical protein
VITIKDSEVIQDGLWIGDIVCEKGKEPKLVFPDQDVYVTHLPLSDMVQIITYMKTLE